MTPEDDDVSPALAASMRQAVNTAKRNANFIFGLGLRFGNKLNFPTAIDEGKFLHGDSAKFLGRGMNGRGMNCFICIPLPFIPLPLKICDLLRPACYSLA